MMELVAWLLLLVLQAGLLGRSMYALLILSDLEADFINPFDVSTRLNSYVMVELLVQLLSLVVVVVARFWLSALLQLGFTIYLVKHHLNKQVYIDATEAFKQLAPQKKWRTALFGCYCTGFMITTYRLVECIIYTVLTPEGRAVARKMFQEAANGVVPGY